MLNDKMFISTALFWVFIVCVFVAMAMFHGKSPSEINSSNVWGFVIGMIGIVAIIVSRVLAVTAISESTSDDENSTR